jgi:hypothetical protein
MWKGIVTAVAGDQFSAALYDVEDETVFEFGDFPLGLFQHAQPGAAFAWTAEDGFLLIDGSLFESEFEKRVIRRLAPA